MITNRIAIVALLLLAFIKPNFAQQTHHFSLEQTLAYAEKNNMQVKNALLDIKLQEQVNREVTGSAYPQINGNGGVTFNPNVATQRLPNFLSPAVIATLQQLGVTDGDGNPVEYDPNADYGFIDAQFGTKWNSNAGVSLNQLLFDGQVFTGLKARNTLIEYQEKNAEVTAEQVRLNVSKIYYQLVLSKIQIALLDSNLALVEKNKHDTKIMYDNGFVEKLEIDKLEVQITNLKSQRTKIINDVNNGYLGLKVLIGMPLKDQLILTDELNDENIKDGILEALTLDYSQRKDYQAALLGEKLNRFDVQRYQLSKIPTLSLSGNYSKMAMQNSFGELWRGTWFSASSISLNLNIPIFKGFATNAKIEQSRIKLRQTQNQIEALKLNIEQEQKSASNTFKTAIADMDFQKQNMSLAERVYQQTKKKYEVGTGSQLEIENARVQLQSAQTNYFNSLYNAVIAKIDFLKASGKL
ncbi:TolC family protein [Niabella insulamsoli]|uniref:TolC family protein n=1 Tax=Niabella insulamsoli TaxID=3144874 RepID=UPI0031FDD608